MRSYIVDIQLRILINLNTKAPLFTKGKGRFNTIFLTTFPFQRQYYLKKRLHYGVALAE